MESLNASREKYFVSEAKNNCEQEINLTSEDKISNIDW